MVSQTQITPRNFYPCLSKFLYLDCYHFLIYFIVQYEGCEGKNNRDAYFWTDPNGFELLLDPTCTNARLGSSSVATVGQPNLPQQCSLTFVLSLYCLPTTPSIVVDHHSLNCFMTLASFVNFFDVAQCPNF